MDDIALYKENNMIYIIIFYINLAHKEWKKVRLGYLEL
jgi:hypothetical protein